MGRIMIEINNLKKDYEIVKRKSLLNKERTIVNAVKKISFKIEDGERVGLIGLNGAGKTTTIKMMTGILYPTDGFIKVNGFTPSDRKKEFLNEIGVSMGQRSCMFYDIDVIESFKYFKEVYEISDTEFEKRLQEFDKVLGLSQLLHTPVRKLSFGQRMKCELAVSLIHLPRTIFLDEPTIGLDVVVQENIFEFLNMINQKYNSTIILTTHEIENIDKFCPRIIVLNHGEVIYDGRCNKFLDRDKYRKLTVSSKYVEYLKDFNPDIDNEKATALLTIDQLNSVDISQFSKSEFTIEELSLEDVLKTKLRVE